MRLRSVRFSIRRLAVAAAVAGALAFGVGVPAFAADATPLAQARSLAASGDVAGAIRGLQPYVAATPLDLTAGRYLGDLRLIAKDPAGAEHAYLAVLQVAPGDRETHDRLGQLYAGQDRLDEAIAQFEKSLPDVGAFASLVRLHARRGDLAAFVESYRRNAEQFPADESAQYAYGVVLLDTHKPQVAADYLRAVVQLDPRSCAGLTELGNALVDLGRTAEGAETIRRCIAINPNDYSALVDLGAAESDADQTDARTLLERAYALNPNRSEAVVNLGYIANAQGHLDAAIALFNRAIAIDPFSRAAYVDLGSAELGEGRLVDAETTYLRGLSVSADDGRIEYMLGETFERQGKPALALREFRSATHSDEPEVVAAATARLSNAR